MITPYFLFQFYLKKQFQKKYNIFLCHPPPSFSILYPLFDISFIHPISLPSLFSISPHSLFLSFRVLNCLFLLAAHSSPSVQYLFSLSIISFFLTLSPRCSGISSVIHLSYSLLYLDSLILSLFSCLSALHSSIFLLLLIFPRPHWHIRSSGNICLSFFPIFFYFSLQHSVSIRHSSLPSILSFAFLFLAFTRSLFLLHSSLIM
jgi:hypothetical protein